jgi:hypothetical protein
MTKEQRPPFLEQVGLRYLERRADAAGPAQAQDAVHILDPLERAALRRLERNAWLRAGATGGLSAFIAGVADSVAQPFHDSNPALFWAIVAPTLVGTALGEVAYLYWDSLRTVDAMARVAGLDLTAAARDVRRGEVAAALVRAAFELPNPPTPVLGIDPRREQSRWRLLAAGLLYKAKVGLTNFIVKALLRRALGRSAVRAVLTFAAVPVTAVWCAVVSFLTLREARVRVLGPSAARELVTAIFDEGPRDLSPAARAMALRAVGASIVRTQDLHPNLQALLHEVRARTGDSPEADLDDSRLFLQRLPALDPDERRLVMRVLKVAVVIDGRLAREEKRLVREAQLACGMPVDDRQVHALRRALLAGDPIPREQL